MEELALLLVDLLAVSLFIDLRKPLRYIQTWHFYWQHSAPTKASFLLSSWEQYLDLFNWVHMWIHGSILKYERAVHVLRSTWNWFSNFEPGFGCKKAFQYISKDVLEHSALQSSINFHGVFNAFYCLAICSQRSKQLKQQCCLEPTLIWVQYSGHSSKDSFVCVFLCLMLLVVFILVVCWVLVSLWRWWQHFDFERVSILV